MATDVELAVLLVGHGTRSSAGTDCLVRLRHRLAAALPEARVEHAFLELQSPTIAEGLSRLAPARPQRLVVAPLLLFSAGHAKSDVPVEVTAALRSLDGFQHTRVVQAGALECHAALVELSQRRYEEAVEPFAKSGVDRSCLLLVGRGSRDVEATAAMHRFAALRQERTAGVDVKVAFLAMAQPLAADAIAALAAGGYERVVVQPHLLFPGELLDGLSGAVVEAGQSQPSCQWIPAPPLAADIGQGGPADTLLVQAVLDRIADAT